MNCFYYLGYEVIKFSDNNLIKVYLLDYKNKIVHQIYKSYSSDLEDKLKSFEHFDNITEFISFAIKRNGKITLDIN